MSKAIGSFDTHIDGSFETVMGDVTFNGFHMFGSDSRLLTGFEPVPEQK